MLVPPADSSLSLVLAYARLIDSRRFDDLRDLMCEDVRIVSPRVEARSFAEFRRGLQVLDGYLRLFHFVGNHSGAWQGDEFSGETYCIASHLYERDGATRKLDMAIRYEDRIVREPDRLRFRERILNVIWTQDAPASLAR